ncbi:MAG: hypothetical protein VX026_01700 [Myxococcota bacterium]|nr:hypothetical protein [Myxococcota bacterium]
MQTQGSSLKKNLLLISPTLIILGVFLGIYVWDRGAFPGFRPTIVDVAIEDINYDDYRGVRITGMARYDVRVKQTIPNGPTYMLFPVVPLEDPNSKYIMVMIRSTKIPDSLYGMEELTVEGFARPPGTLVDKEIMLAWMDEGFVFDDKFVLVEAYDD